MSMLSLCVHYNLYGGDTNKRSPHEHSRPSPNELRFSSQSETLNLPIIIFLQIDPISNSNNRTRRNVRNKIIAKSHQSGAGDTTLLQLVLIIIITAGALLI